MTADGTGANHYRAIPGPEDAPPLRWYDPAVWLRMLAGVDERLLRDATWVERAKHTALGGIVLGTGLLAGLSMWMAISQALGGGVKAVYLIPAVIWTMFIVSVDRALITTMSGSGRKMGAFLFRLLISIFFGIIIAEPLTIRVFAPAVENNWPPTEFRRSRTCAADLRSATPLTW